MSVISDFSGISKSMASNIISIEECINFQKCERFKIIVKQFEGSRFYINSFIQTCILELKQQFQQLFQQTQVFDKERSIDPPGILKEADSEYDRFQSNITKMIRTNVEETFAKLLSYFGIKENTENTNLTLKQRAKLISTEGHESKKCREVFLRTGIFLSIVSKSMLSPLINENIMHFYRLFITQKLKIQIDCVLIKDGAEFEFDDLATTLQGDYKIVFKENMHLLGAQLLKNLKRWTQPIECVLPDKVFEAQPADFRCIEALYTEMISEHLSNLDAYLLKLNATVLPTLEICYKTPIEGLVAQEYFDFCDSQFEQLKKIGSGFRRKLINTNRGIFMVNISHVSNSIDYAIKKSQNLQEIRTKDYLNARVRNLLSSYDRFFSIVEPNKFEQTKKASFMVKDLERSIPNIIDQINDNLLIKAYLDSKLWSLEDTEVEKFYSSCTGLSKLYSFMDLKKKQVIDSLEKLRQGIGREIQMFMNLWTNVETAMNKLFSSPTPKIPTILIGGPVEVVKHQADFLSEEQIVTSLNYIIKHISNAADIANIISKKVDLLENVPGTEEMRRIWTLMKSRNILVQVLMVSRNKLRDWMEKPLYSIDVDEIEKEGAKFITIFDQSDLCDCWLVSSSRGTLESFLGRDLPVIKSLKNPILQVNVSHF